MKYNLLTSIVFLLFLTCTQNKALNGDQTSVQKKENFSAIEVESIKMRDSLKISSTLTADFGKKLLVFKGLNNNVLDSLYHVEREDSISLKSYSKKDIKAHLEKEKTSFFNTVKSDSKAYMPSFRQTWNQNSEMDVFSNRNGFLTIQYLGDGFMGGAHGYAYEIYKVVDVRNQMKIQLEDILNVNNVDWNPLLLRYLGHRSTELFDKNKLSYTQNFYFDKEKLTFVYGQYEIAAFAFGIIKIEVPLKEIQGALRPEFITRMGL